MFVFGRAELALSLAIVLPIVVQTPGNARSAKHPRGSSAHYSVSQLYSSRARHRAVTILQLKLLELHEEHLDRLRRIILRKLPIDTLLKADGPPG